VHLKGNPFHGNKMPVASLISIDKKQKM